MIRVAFKPTATTPVCWLARAVPMVEAMGALVHADRLLRQQGQCSLW